MLGRTSKQPGWLERCNLLVLSTDVWCVRPRLCGLEVDMKSMVHLYLADMHMNLQSQLYQHCASEYGWHAARKLKAICDSVWKLE